MGGIIGILFLFVIIAALAIGFYIKKKGELKYDVNSYELRRSLKISTKNEEIQRETRYSSRQGIIIECPLNSFFHNAHDVILTSLIAVSELVYNDNDN